MYKIPLNIGTLAGLVAFALFLILYAVGVSPVSLKFVGFWIPVVAILYANIHTRRVVLGGNMTYAQGFLCGMITMLIWCSFKGFAMYIFMTLFNQHVIEQYVDFTHKTFEIYENTTNQAMQNKDEVEKFLETLTPWKLMIFDINNNALYGSLLVIISAFITRRLPKMPIK